MGHTLFFESPPPVAHVTAAFDATPEVLTCRQLARQLGETARSVREGHDVIQVCAGAYVREGGDQWRFYSDAEWEA